MSVSEHSCRSSSTRKAMYKLFLLHSTTTRNNMNHDGGILCEFDELCELTVEDFGKIQMKAKFTYGKSVNYYKIYFWLRNVNTYNTPFEKSYPRLAPSYVYRFPKGTKFARNSSGYPHLCRGTLSGFVLEF